MEISRCKSIKAVNIQKASIMKNYSYAKTHPIIISVVFVLSAMTILNSSCTKTSIEPLHNYDKNYFFTVNINNKTYTTYAWVDRSYSYITDTPFIAGVYSVHQDSTGVLPWELVIGVTAERTRNIYVPAAGTCTAWITLTKTGDFLGQYEVLQSNENYFDNIEGKSYHILPGKAILNTNYLPPPEQGIPA